MVETSMKILQFLQQNSDFTAYIRAAILAFLPRPLGVIFIRN